MNQITVQRCDFRMHDMIDGKFRVERVLNSTSTDQMFKVNDTSGKEYILKLIKLWKEDPRLRQQVLHSAEYEIKSCQIKSNYLTNIVQTGTVNGNPYWLMEYNRSRELSNFQRNARLDLVKVVKELLYGLRDLHHSGIVHCQLTPEHVLITDNGHVMITNYIILGGRGNFVIQKNRTLQNRFVDKSLAYQAPELYRLDRCATVLPSIDLFSFGVILFQLLTGELPFGRLATEADLIQYQSRAKSNDWNKNILLRHEQREMWMHLLESCLAPDSSNRVNDIDELLRLLPEDENHYQPMEGSQVEAPKKILNGIMLHVLHGDDFGNYYRLPEILQQPRRIITIGRADQAIFNMIPLKEGSASYISRRHCTIEWDDEEDAWYIRDGQWNKEAKEQWTRSLNGTFVNSDRVTEEGHLICPGDIISVGDIKLRVEAY